MKHIWLGTSRTTAQPDHAAGMYKIVAGDVLEGWPENIETVHHCYDTLNALYLRRPNIFVSPAPSPFISLFWSKYTQVCDQVFVGGGGLEGRGRNSCNFCLLFRKEETICARKDIGDTMRYAEDG